MLKKALRLSTFFIYFIIIYIGTIKVEEDITVTYIFYLFHDTTSRSE